MKTLKKWLENPCPALIYTCLFFLTASLLFLSYKPALDAGPFFIDDGQYLEAVPRGQFNFQKLYQIFEFTPKPFYLPFMLLTYQIDYTIADIFSVSPYKIMRLSSIAYLSLATLAFFWLFRRQRHAWLPASFVALIFALHPLHTIPTIWITSRKDVLVTLFMLLTVVFKLKRRIGFGILAFALALMSKHNAYCLLIWIVTDEVFFQYEHLKDRFHWKPFFRGCLLNTAPFIVMFLLFMPLSMNYSTGHPSPIQFIWRQSLPLVQFYLGQILWPSVVTQYYPRPAPLSSWLAVLSWVFLLSAFFVPALLFFKKRLSLLHASLWILAFTLIEPYVFMVPGVLVVNNAYTYSFMAPVLLLLFNGILRFLNQVSYQKNYVYLPFYAFMFLAILLMIPNNQKLAAEFAKPVEAFERNIALFPEDAFIQTRYAHAAHSEGQLDKALSGYKKALQLHLKNERRLAIDAFSGVLEICILKRDMDCLEALGRLSAKNNRPFYCQALQKNVPAVLLKNGKILAPCQKRFN